MEKYKNKFEYRVVLARGIVNLKFIYTPQSCHRVKLRKARVIYYVIRPRDAAFTHRAFIVFIIRAQLSGEPFLGTHTHLIFQTHAWIQRRLRTVLFIKQFVPTLIPEKYKETYSEPSFTRPIYDLRFQCCTYTVHTQWYYCRFEVLKILNFKWIEEITLFWSFKVRIEIIFKWFSIAFSKLLSRMCNEMIINSILFCLFYVIIQFVVEIIGLWIFISIKQI